MRQRRSRLNSELTFTFLLLIDHHHRSSLGQVIMLSHLLRLIVAVLKTRRSYGSLSCRTSTVPGLDPSLAPLARSFASLIW